MMYTPGYAGEDFLNMDPYFISDKKKKEGICLSVKGLSMVLWQFCIQA